MSVDEAVRHDRRGGVTGGCARIETVFAWLAARWAASSSRATFPHPCRSAAFHQFPPSMAMPCASGRSSRGKGEKGISRDRTCPRPVHSAEVPVRAGPRPCGFLTGPRPMPQGRLITVFMQEDVRLDQGRVVVSRGTEGPALMCAPAGEGHLLPVTQPLSPRGPGGLRAARCLPLAAAFGLTLVDVPAQADPGSRCFSDRQTSWLVSPGSPRAAAAQLFDFPIASC